VRPRTTPGGIASSHRAARESRPISAAPHPLGAGSPPGPPRRWRLAIASQGSVPRKIDSGASPRRRDGAAGQDAGSAVAGVLGATLAELRQTTGWLVQGVRLPVHSGQQAQSADRVHEGRGDDRMYQSKSKSFGSNGGRCLRGWQPFFLSASVTRSLGIISGLWLCHRQFSLVASRWSEEDLRSGLRLRRMFYGQFRDGRKAMARHAAVHFTDRERSPTTTAGIQRA